MLKYCALVMDPKYLKSMISKHQNHILGSLGVPNSFKYTKQKTAKIKKEDNEVWNFKQKTKLEFTLCQSWTSGKQSRASSSLTLPLNWKNERERTQHLFSFSFFFPAFIL